MCTVSWRSTGDGYELFFNRDELRTRQRALPPRRMMRDATEILTPIDADAGGSWLTTNRFGVTVALLNRYGIKTPSAANSTHQRSRGQLVLDLATSVDRLGALERLRSFDLGAFQPFTLVLLEVAEPPMMTAWDGHELDPILTPQAPLVSSSHDSAEATRARQDLWRQTVDLDDSPTLAAFHRSHEPARGAASPCMHRQDARTVSSTRVRVTAATVEMAYADGPPCVTPYGAPLALGRLRAVDAA